VKSGSKIKNLLLVILMLAGTIAGAMALSLGGGFFYLEDFPYPVLNGAITHRYFSIEQSATYIDGFGFANFVDLYGKIDWVITPIVGLGTCWGFSYDDLLFVERGGIYLGGGLLLSHGHYSLQIVLKHYIPFFQEIVFSPSVQLIGRFKIGEWWE